MSKPSGKQDPLTRHRGLATWGEKLVPLDDFRQAVAKAGVLFSDAERREQESRFLEPIEAPEPKEGPYGAVVLFGGVYSNSYALEALLEESRKLSTDRLYCLGDLGGFGPLPERCWPLLEQGDVRVLQGNYEQSLASGAEDCNCGYADPRDNHFAEISYRYTQSNCSEGFKQWMGKLPETRRVRVGDFELLLVHGSPRRVNQFLFESTTPVAYLETLCDLYRCDVLAFTHTGLHWKKLLPSGRWALNVGVIGRPANDGQQAVWFSRVAAGSKGLEIELCPLEYDFESLALSMAREDLPAEFIETVRTGWWTTCLEVLPAKERSVSRF